MSLRAALVLSAFIHLAVLIAVDHTAVPPSAVLRLPSGALKVDMVQAAHRAKAQPQAASQTTDRPVAAASEPGQERESPQTGNKTGTTPSRPAPPEDGTTANSPGGFSAPGAPSRAPDNFTQAMTPLMYSQMLTAMSVRYFQTTHDLVLAHLQTALAGGLVRELDGEQAMVAAVYAERNELRSLAVDAQNEKLKDILQTGVPWRTIPAPGSLSLPYQEMFFLISIEKGKIYLRLSPEVEKPNPHP